MQLDEFAVFSLSQDKSPAEVTLRSADWAVITQVDGHKTVKDIADTLSFSIEEALARFTWLFDKGLIRYESSDNKDEIILPASFFTTLQDELTQIIGPVAPLVIEDVLWSLDSNVDQFKAENTATLIESLTEEIPDEKKKLIFQQKMLELLKRLETE